MGDEKDILLGKLAVEGGHITQDQLDEACRLRQKMHDEFGMDQSLEQVLVGKHYLTPDLAQELRHAVAIQTGDARLIADYEVVAKLGQGGMGAVYKARHQATGQFVALKILPPSLADKEHIARFEREAKIVQNLNHANIVGCVEFGYDPRRKVHFCALELVEGEDLGERLERLGGRPLAEKDAISITYQIGQALEHAHLAGLVHRDVKPENILVMPDGTAKLLDLGLARRVDKEATRLTESGMVVGSPYYISPEQARAERDIDIRADIYALGATLYHMVTGRPPFEGGTYLMVLQQHVYEKITWPADVNPALSDGMCRVIAKMMAKKPAERYQKPKKLLADLLSLMEGETPQVSDAMIRNSTVESRRPRRRLDRRAGRGREQDQAAREARLRQRQERAAANLKKRTIILLVILGVGIVFAAISWTRLMYAAPTLWQTGWQAVPAAPSPRGRRPRGRARLVHKVKAVWEAEVAVGEDIVEYSGQLTVEDVRGSILVRFPARGGWTVQISDKTIFRNRDAGPGVRVFSGSCLRRGENAVKVTFQGLWPPGPPVVELVQESGRTPPPSTSKGVRGRSVPEPSYVIGSWDCKFTGVDGKTGRLLIRLLKDGIFDMYAYPEGGGQPKRARWGTWKTEGDHLVLRATRGPGGLSRVRIVDADTMELEASEGTCLCRRATTPARPRH